MWATWFRRETPDSLTPNRHTSVRGSIGRLSRCTAHTRARTCAGGWAPRTGARSDERRVATLQHREGNARNWAMDHGAGSASVRSSKMASGSQKTTAPGTRTVNTIASRYKPMRRSGGMMVTECSVQIPSSFPWRVPRRTRPTCCDCSAYTGCQLPARQRATKIGPRSDTHVPSVLPPH